MKHQVKINGVDATSHLVKWSVDEEFGENITQIELTLLNTATLPVVGQTITVKRGQVYAEEQFIFNGYIIEVIKEAGLYKLICKDMLIDLIRNEVTYSYDINVDTEAGVASEIFKSLINVHGGGNLIANSTTVQSTGTTNVLHKFVCNHEDVYKKCEELAELYDYQFYYTPVQTETNLIDGEETTDWTVITGAQDTLTLNTTNYIQGSAAVNFNKSGNEEDLFLLMNETSGTTANDSSVSNNDAVSQQDTSGMTTTTTTGNAFIFNGVSGDREDCKRYLLNDDAATTVVINDATGADGTSTRNTSLMINGSVENSPMGNKALYFNGTTDYIILGDIGSPGTYFSAEAWVKFDEILTETVYNIVTNADDYEGSNGCDIQFAVYQGKLVLDFNNGSWHTMQGTGTLTAGTWYHIAVTYDSWQTTNNCKFYINGELDSQVTDDVAQGASLPNNCATWHIGAYISTTAPTGTYDPFKGLMSNLKVSTSRIFGPNEIKASYNSGNGTEELQDYLTLGSNCVMNLTSGCSISFWMKTDNQHYTNLFAKDKNASLGFLAFSSGSANTWKYEPDDNNFGGDSSVLTTNINDGVLHHYVHTWVINGANVDWNIYVDGTLEYSGSHTKPTNPTFTLKYIGINGSLMRYIYGEAFNGELRDVRIYTDKLLSATEEIPALYNGGAGQNTPLGEASNFAADASFSATDLSNDNLYARVYIADQDTLDKITSVTIYTTHNSSGWNKYEHLVSTGAVTTGWNLLRLGNDNFTVESGGATETAINKVRVRVFTNNNGDTWEEGKVVVDNFFYHVDGSGLVYFEPKGFLGQNGTLTVGDNIQKNLKWNYDATELLNDVTVFGAKTNVQTEKYFSGDAVETDFALDFEPVDIRVEYPVGTVLKGGLPNEPEAQYYLDKTAKKVVFTDAPASASNNVYIRYSYAVPVPVTGYNQASKTAYKLHKKTMFFDDIQTTNDAELKVKQLLNSYSQPFVSTTVVPITQYDLHVGQTVRVVDALHDEDRIVLVNSIKKVWPHTGDTIDVGDKTWKTSNWQVEVMDRIMKLEEQNAKISEYLVHVINSEHSANFRKKSLNIYKTTYTNNNSGGIYGHPVLGVYGTSKYGAPDMSVDNQLVYSEDYY